MKASEFCYWLQGYFEISGEMFNGEVGSLTEQQADLIRRHLALVFHHDLDPQQGTPEHQAELQSIHDGPKNGGSGTDEHVYRC